MRQPSVACREQQRSLGVQRRVASLAQLLVKAAAFLDDLQVDIFIGKSGLLSRSPPGPESYGRSYVSHGRPRPQGERQPCLHDSSCPRRPFPVQLALPRRRPESTSACSMHAAVPTSHASKCPQLLLILPRGATPARSLCVCICSCTILAMAHLSGTMGSSNTQFRCRRPSVTRMHALRASELDPVRTLCGSHSYRGCFQAYSVASSLTSMWCS